MLVSKAIGFFQKFRRNCDNLQGLAPAARGLGIARRRRGAENSGKIQWLVVSGQWPVIGFRKRGVIDERFIFNSGLKIYRICGIQAAVGGEAADQRPKKI